MKKLFAIIGITVLFLIVGLCGCILSDPLQDDKNIFVGKWRYDDEILNWIEYLNDGTLIRHNYNVNTGEWMTSTNDWKLETIEVSWIGDYYNFNTPSIGGIEGSYESIPITYTGPKNFIVVTYESWNSMETDFYQYEIDTFNQLHLVPWWGDEEPVFKDVDRYTSTILKRIDENKENEYVNHLIEWKGPIIIECKSWIMYDVRLQEEYYSDFPFSSYDDSVVSFSGEAKDIDGKNITYEWDFGDGTYGYGISPRHTYRSNGSYKVTLTVIDEDGKQESEAIIVDIDKVGKTIAEENTNVSHLISGKSNCMSLKGFTISYSGSEQNNSWGINGYFEILDKKSIQNASIEIQFFNKDDHYLGSGIILFEGELTEDTWFFRELFYGYNNMHYVRFYMTYDGK